MTSTQRIRFWMIGAVVFVVLLYLLRGVLLPFVAGMAVAYFLDPLADRLERMGLSRILATAVITLAFFGLAVVAAMVLVPAIQQQVISFVQKVPDYVDTLQQRLHPLFVELQKKISSADIQRLRSSLGGYAGTAVGWVAGLAQGVLTGSLAVFSVLSLMFITPVVTFYLLRDWDTMVARIDSWLPLHHAAEIRDQFREIDRTLAGFVRGQATVCISLAAFYGLALTLVGLDLGLVIGAFTGLGAFVPYVGMLIGLVVSMALAIAQDHGWSLPGLVALVFIIGNVLEGNILTPKLVGDRVGLHPVWIIFSLLAGGALFGFVGILLAVPMAAVIGVVVRFALSRYLSSSLYTGGDVIP
ncbi:MAG: AI-2E family transporter [Actinomycetota bacterium]